MVYEKDLNLVSEDETPEVPETPEEGSDDEGGDNE